MFECRGTQDRAPNYTLSNWRGRAVLWMVLGQNSKALITCQIHRTVALGMGRRLGRFPRLNGVQVGERIACSKAMSRWGQLVVSALCFLPDS